MTFPISHRAFLWISIAAFTSFFFQEERPHSTHSTKQLERFSRGERLSYRAHYGLLNAAEAVVHLDTSYHRVDKYTCYKVDIDAKTTGSFAFVYDVDNLYRSFIDTGAVIPRKFYRNVSENKYKLEETVQFEHHQKKAKVRQNKKGKIKEKEFDLPQYAQDIVSGYYYLRTVDFAKMHEGDTIQMDAFFENEVYDFKILYLGKKKLKTKFGKINSVELAPIMPDNSFFRGKNSVKLWISDDENKVPLKVRAKIFVGAFEIELDDYEGLRHEFEIE